MPGRAGSGIYLLLISTEEAESANDKYELFRTHKVSNRVAVLASFIGHAKYYFVPVSSIIRPLGLLSGSVELIGKHQMQQALTRGYRDILVYSQPAMLSKLAKA